jgi:transposase InsO family protein
MRMESKGGVRYFTTFTDDYSRWTKTYLIRKKSEVASKFREYKKFVETQLEIKIKAVQSDNGKEYCNEEMDKFFRNSGIQRHLTTVYSPQQNGLAERRNRTLVEAARCMLLESGLPARCISKSIDGDIPYKRWTRKSPHVSHQQIFGCKAYVLDKSTNRGKFDSKTVEGIFVGYSDYPKGY